MGSDFFLWILKCPVTHSKFHFINMTQVEGKTRQPRSAVESGADTASLCQPRSAVESGADTAPHCVSQPRSAVESGADTAPLCHSCRGPVCSVDLELHWGSVAAVLVCRTRTSPRLAGGCSGQSSAAMHARRHSFALGSWCWSSIPSLVFIASCCLSCGPVSYIC